MKILNRTIPDLDGIDKPILCLYPRPLSGGCGDGNTVRRCGDGFLQAKAFHDGGTEIGNQARAVDELIGAVQ